MLYKDLMRTSEAFTSPEDIEIQAEDEEAPRAATGEAPSEMMREEPTRTAFGFLEPAGGFRGMRYRAGSATERAGYEKDIEAERRAGEKGARRKHELGLVAAAETKEREKKQKESKALRTGFATAYKASPELQELLPDLDIEDMAASEIHGMMAALKIGEQAKGLRPKEVMGVTEKEFPSGTRVVTGPPGGFAVTEKPGEEAPPYKPGEVVGTTPGGAETIYAPGGEFKVSRPPAPARTPQLGAEKMVYYNRRRRMIRDELTKHEKARDEGDMKVGVFGPKRDDEIRRLKGEMADIEDDIRAGGREATMAGAPAPTTAPAALPGPTAAPAPVAAGAEEAAPVAAGAEETVIMESPDGVRRRVPKSRVKEMEALGGRVVA